MKNSCIILFVLAILSSCNVASKKADSSQSACVVIETPADAIEALKAGNKRFVEGCSLHEHSNMGYVKRLDSEGQHPFATVIACSDSRVPVELLFDQGFGDIFVIRTAGNTLVDNVTLGSVDYAINHLQSKVVVVLGHTNCGAVTAVVNMGHEHGHEVENDHEVQELLENIATYIPQHKGSQTNLDGAVLDNVAVQKEMVVSRPHIQQLIEEKKLEVVSAIYHLDSGEVEFL